MSHVDWSVFYPKSTEAMLESRPIRGRFSDSSGTSPPASDSHHQASDFEPQDVQEVINHTTEQLSYTQGTIAYHENSREELHNVRLCDRNVQHQTFSSLSDHVNHDGYPLQFQSLQRPTIGPWNGSQSMPPRFVKLKENYEKKERYFLGDGLLPTPNVLPNVFQMHQPLPHCNPYAYTNHVATQYFKDAYGFLYAPPEVLVTNHTPPFPGAEDELHHDPQSVLCGAAPYDVYPHPTLTWIPQTPHFEQNYYENTSDFGDSVSLDSGAESMLSSDRLEQEQFESQAGFENENDFIVFSSDEESSEIDLEEPENVRVEDEPLLGEESDTESDDDDILSAIAELFNESTRGHKVAPAKCPLPEEALLREVRLQFDELKFDTDNDVAEPECIGS